MHKYYWRRQFALLKAAARCAFLDGGYSQTPQWTASKRQQGDCLVMNAAQDRISTDAYRAITGQ
jgi:hypothetical protein